MQGQNKEQSLGDLLKQKGRERLRIRTVKYEKQNTLYDQGEPAYWVCLLLEGEADLVKRTPAGQRYIIERILPGELFGLEPLAGG